MHTATQTAHHKPSARVVCRCVRLQEEQHSHVASKGGGARKSETKIKQHREGSGIRVVKNKWAVKKTEIGFSCE